MFKKRDFLVLLIVLVIIFFFVIVQSQSTPREQVLEEEHTDHGFGPKMNFSNYSENSLILISIIGLIITMICAVLLERNISRIASKTGKGIGTALIGIASSIPLLVIVVTLALENRADLVLTNVVSANIANLTLVLGILSFFKPLRRGKSFQKGFLALFIMLLSILIISFFINSNFEIVQDSSRNIASSEGIILIALLAFFILFLNFFKSSEGSHLKSKNFGKEIFFAIFYGVAVAWFASTTVKAFILIAEIHSVPAIIIGSVIGVIGASLPELAIGLVCLIKKEHEAIFSNLITSNIVNFNLGLGLAAIIMGGL